MLWLISLALCVLLSASPAYADTSGPPAATRGEYVQAPTVQVPELRQRALSEAQKVITDARLRLQVSGGPPADPTREGGVEQKPEPNTPVRAGTTGTGVVQAPPAQRPAPRQAMVVDQKPAKGTRVPLNSVVMVAVRILPTPQPESPTVPRVPPTAPPHVTPPYTPPPTASPPTAPPPRDEWVLVPGLRQRPLM